MAEDEGGAVRERVQLFERRVQAAAGMGQAPAVIRADRAESVNDAIVSADLQVQRYATREEGIAFSGFQRGLLGLETVIPADVRSRLGWGGGLGIHLPAFAGMTVSWLHCHFRINSTRRLAPDPMRRKSRIGTIVLQLPEIP